MGSFSYAPLLIGADIVPVSQGTGRMLAEP